MMRFLAPCCALAALAIALTWASAADLPPQVAPAPAVAPRSAGGFAAPDATCLEWTDGCRTCQRRPSGEAACSNVGIACVPKDSRCTQR